MSACPACGGKLRFYAWGEVCCGSSGIEDAGCGYNAHNAKFANIHLDPPGVCYKTGCAAVAHDACRFCKKPICGDHLEWTLDGIVCDQCVERVPAEYL